jgi:hypothetical protein
MVVITAEGSAAGKIAAPHKQPVNAESHDPGQHDSGMHTPRKQSVNY